MGKTQTKRKGCGSSRLQRIVGQTRRCSPVPANLGYSIANIIRCPLTYTSGGKTDELSLGFFRYSVKTLNLTVEYMFQLKAYI